MKNKTRKILSILLTLIILFVPVFNSNATEEKYTPTGIPYSELESRIDAVVAKHLGIATPGAAVVVVHNGEIIFSKGYGYADIENGIPVDPANTVFDYASVSKLFVWVSVMQLVEQGLIDLDADIASYLPADFIRQLKLKYPINMRDLLNHSAGFEPTAFNITFDSLVPESLVPLKEALIKSAPKQNILPGTASAYSNYGVALAAYVVACVSGLDYLDYEKNNIFQPSGMNTLSLPDYIKNSAFTAKRAHPYTPDLSGGFTKDLGNIKFTIWPSGMTSGTAEDLAQFALALTPTEGQAGPLFEFPSGLARIFTPSSLEPVKIPGTYHGFWGYNGVSPAYGHAGHSYHFSNFVIMPEERFGFLSISNGFEDVNVAVSNLLLGYDPNQVQQSSINLPPASEVEGAFQLYQARFESHFLALLNHFTPPDSVTALNENTIEFNLGMFGKATYLQTEPYFYQIISTDNPHMTLYFNTLRFQVVDGSPVQIHVGFGKDLTSVSQNPLYGLLLVGFLVSCVFFITFPLVLLIAFFVNKKKGITKTRFDLMSNCFFFSGTLLVINNLLIFGKLVTATILTSASLAPHIYINYFIAILSTVLFIISLLQLLKEEARKSKKIFFIGTTVLMAVLYIVLYTFKFFAFI